jgi:hypothetical protein
MNYRTTNFILIGITVISTIALLQVIFGFFELNPFDFDNRKISDVNNIFVGLILGFYINALFYLLNSVIPHSKNKKRAIKVCQPYIRDIYKRLKISQSYFLFKLKKTNWKEIKSTDFTEFKKLQMEKLKFSFKETTEEGETSMSFGGMTEIDFFEIEKTVVLNNINVILSNPYVSNLNEELKFILTKIKNQMFYIGVKHHVEMGYHNHFTYIDLEKYMYEHFTLINDLIQKVEYLNSKSELNLK